MDQKPHLNDQQLDDLLQALQSGQAHPDGAAEQNASLAADLVALAKSSQADPAFVATLGARLRGAARAGQPADHATHSIFSRLLNTRTRSGRATPVQPKRTPQDRRQVPMKRLFVALTSGATLVALIALAASLPFTNTQPGKPGATGQAGQGPAPTAPPQPGGIAGQSTPTPVPVEGIRAPLMWNITEFVLADSLGGLPTAPGASMLLYHQMARGVSTIEDARRFAQRFGLQPNVYRMQVPTNEDTGFTVIDGTRKLIVREGIAYYTDDAMRNAYGSQSSLPYTRAVEVAETFLQARGLLDFEYRVEPADNPQARTMRFVPLANGHPIASSSGAPGVYVTVTPDGQIASVVYNIPQLEPAGEAPVIDVKEAWKTLTSGNVSRFSQGGVSAVRPDTGQDTRYWMPEYQPSAGAHVYGDMIRYIPAEGNGAPVLYLDGLRVEGKLGALQGYESGKGNLVHAWGTLRQDASGEVVLVADGAEMADPTIAMSQRGAIKRQQGKVLFTRNDGKVFTLPHTPASLPDGIAVSLFGWEVDRTVDGYPVLQWITIQSPPEDAQVSAGVRGMGVSSAMSVGVRQVMVPALPAQTPTAALPVDPNAPRDIATSAPAAASQASPTPLPMPTAVPPQGNSLPFTDGQQLDGFEGTVQVMIIEDEDGSNREVHAFLSYQPLDANQPGWQVPLTGANLADIEKSFLLPVKVWGRVKFDGQNSAVIDVDRYEKADPDARIQAWAGDLVTATVDGKLILLLKSNDGKQYAMAYSIRWPVTQLREPGKVVVEGVLRPETFGGYPVIEEDARTVANGLDMSQYRLQTQPPRQIRVKPAKAIVEQVELVYQVDEPVRVLNPDGTPPAGEAVKPLARPMWRFAGHTERGESFEALIEALPEAQLQALGLAQSQFSVPAPMPATAPLAVGPAPTARPATPVNAVFGEQIKLVAFELGGAKVNNPLHITLHWQALAKMEQDFSVFVHLVDPATGKLLAQLDAPVGRQDKATAEWAQGEGVLDEDMLNIPDLPSGEYELRIGVYAPQTGVRLATNGADELTLTRIEVRDSKATEPRSPQQEP